MSVRICGSAIAVGPCIPLQFKSRCVVGARFSSTGGLSWSKALRFDDYGRKESDIEHGLIDLRTVAPTRRWSELRAKRKAAPVVREEEDEMDEDMRTGLNEVANEAIKVMLSEDIQKLAAFKDKVDYLGEFLVDEGQLEAARFMLVVKSMLEHEVAPEAELLEGPYLKAYEKIGGMLEDSGWLLQVPGQEGGNVEMVDDEMIPPVLGTSYFQ